MDPMKVKVLITTFKQILFHVGSHHTDMNARGDYSSATDSKTTVGCLRWNFVFQRDYGVCGVIGHEG